VTNDIRALLESLYASFASGDASAYLDDLADDVVIVGTDESEFWQGREEVTPVLQAQLSEMSAAGIRVTAGEVLTGESGGAAWAADRPTLHLPDGSSQTLRATLVATREGDALVVQQMHLSAPAPNAEVLQMELTTE
jgi:uncharacterized protein (TIGR02246 family)